MYDRNLGGKRAKVLHDLHSYTPARFWHQLQWLRAFGPCAQRRAGKKERVRQLYS